MEGHRVVASDRWVIPITNQVHYQVLHVRGKELPDDQHICAGSAGA